MGQVGCTHQKLKGGLTGLESRRKVRLQGILEQRGRVVETMDVGVAPIISRGGVGLEVIPVKDEEGRPALSRRHGLGHKERFGTRYVRGGVRRKGFDLVGIGARRARHNVRRFGSIICESLKNTGCPATSARGTFLNEAKES